jgi:hypothetical protein
VAHLPGPETQPPPAAGASEVVDRLGLRRPPGPPAPDQEGGPGQKQDRGRDCHNGSSCP